MDSNQTERPPDSVAAAPAVRRQEPTVEADNAALLTIVSILALICVLARILYQIGGTELTLFAAMIWIPFFALTTGGSARPAATQVSAPARRVPGRGGEPPFQFGLSDLLCAVFVVAMLMGILFMIKECDRGDDAHQDLWNFLCGSIMAVATALLISSWRTRSRPGLIVGIPIFLGTLAHLIWGLPADDYVLLAWSLLGLYLGLTRLWVQDRGTWSAAA